MSRRLRWVAAIACLSALFVLAMWVGGRAPEPVAGPPPPVASTLREPAVEAPPADPTSEPGAAEEAPREAAPEVATGGASADAPPRRGAVRRARPYTDDPPDTAAPVRLTVWPLSAQGFADGLEEVEAVHGKCTDLPDEPVTLKLNLHVTNEDGIGVVRVQDVQDSSSGRYPAYLDCLIAQHERIQIEPPPEGAVAQVSPTIRFFPAKGE